MSTARHPRGHLAGVAGALREQSRGERARDRALARARGPVEQVGVRRPHQPLQHRHKQRACVRVRLDAGKRGERIGGSGPAGG